MTLSSSFLDELRARTSLSGLVAKSVKLQKAGREHKGCCPFHQEKTPSFYVNDEKGFYHCFGCSAHGDAIRWMTDHRGLDFIDAVRELAAAAGLDMPARDPATSDHDARRARAFEIMARAMAFYASELRRFGADGAQTYLAGRGISPSDAALFDLGWAPLARRGEASRFRAEMRDVSDDVLIDLGLLKRPEDGLEPYDFFRGRIMIPIHDARGRCIGFGGRAMGDAQPKYLNSPQTLLFDKGSTLFNLHRAIGPAQRNKRLVVVEGYLDVIAMHRCGIDESVAPNGTALTEAQLGLLWRRCSEPILCFDGDAAGRRAAVRAAMLALPLIEPGRTLRFAFPPPGSDPDDLLRESGPQAVSALLAQTRDIVSVLWEAELNAHGLVDDPDARAARRHRIGQIVREIRSEVVRNEYMVAFQKLLSAGQPRRRAQSTIASLTSVGSSIESAVVVGMIRHPDIVASEFEVIATIRWTDPRANRVAGALVEAAMLGKLSEATVWPVLERADLAGDALAMQASVGLAFGFVRGPVTLAGGAELLDALSRMARS